MYHILSLLKVSIAQKLRISDGEKFYDMLSLAVLTGLKNMTIRQKTK